MTLETAFFTCAFGGLIFGGLIGELIEHKKAKKAKLKKAQAIKLRQNQLITFRSCAEYNPQEPTKKAIGY